MTIKELRQINRLSQDDLAKMLNVSQNAVSKWERIDTKFREDIEKRITELFGYKKESGRLSSFNLGTKKEK